MTQLEALYTIELHVAMPLHSAGYCIALFAYAYNCALNRELESLSRNGGMFPRGVTFLEIERAGSSQQRTAADALDAASAAYPELGLVVMTRFDATFLRDLPTEPGVAGGAAAWGDYVLFAWPSIPIPDQMHVIGGTHVTAVAELIRRSDAPVAGGGGTPGALAAFAASLHSLPEKLAQHTPHVPIAYLCPELAGHPGNSAKRGAERGSDGGGGDRRGGGVTHLFEDRTRPSGDAVHAAKLRKARASQDSLAISVDGDHFEVIFLLPGCAPGGVGCMHAVLP